MPAAVPLEVRFWRHVDKAGPLHPTRPELGPCWLWTASTNGRGYGAATVGRKRRQAHRVAWELVRGPFPEGLEPDHTCLVKLCVNPDHLEPVTHAENMRRARAAGLGAAALNAARETCPAGHPLDEVYNDRGWRRCSVCTRRIQREADARYRERKRRRAAA